MPDNTMETVFAILRPQGTLTEEVIVALRRLFDGRLVVEIGNLQAWKIANEIVARSEVAGFPAEADPVEVAGDLRKFMLAAEFVTDEPGKGAPPSGTFKVVMDKGPDTMNARELLTLLAGDPSRASELLPYIERLEVVRKAKSPSWVITNADGTLNVEATLGYLDHLAKMFSIPRREVGGRHPMPLARALGLDERPLLNPFAFNSRKPEEAVVTGPIFEDYDLASLTDERHLAYIWAAATRRREWPAVIDPYEHIPAAFAEPLAGRWLRIVEDYRAAVEAHEPETEGLTRYVTSDLMAAAEQAASGQASQPAHNDDWYRQELYAIAEPAVRANNSSVSRGSNDIVVSISANNGTVRLDGTIVLDNVTANNGNITGTATGAPGFTTSARNGVQNLRVRRMNWEALYNEAKRRSIL